MPADRVYDAIYAAIVDHRLGPGSRLREEELAQTFAVSRTLVRQALHRLAQDGVILLRPNKGAVVPEPTRRDGEHVFDARRVVECEVARSTNAPNVPQLCSPSAAGAAGSEAVLLPAIR